MYSEKYNIINTLSDEQLLSTRLCDLRLSLKGSWLEACKRQLDDELLAKGLRFKPYMWISTEWFSPYGVPGFAVPFYLLHPRLVALERHFMGEAEGDSSKSCLQLMRHETGHAIDNAFKLRLSKKRQALFGHSTSPYPAFYEPCPGHPDFIEHLPNFYAQAHPDEDWAESFALWLAPKSQWQKYHHNTKAGQKLACIDSMMAGLKSRKQIVTTRDEVESLKHCQESLGEYFLRKQARFGLDADQKIAKKRQKPQYQVKKVYKTVTTELHQQNNWGISATRPQAQGELARRVKGHIKEALQPTLRFFM